MKIKINLANDIALFKKNIYDLFVNPERTFIDDKINIQTYIFLFFTSIFAALSYMIPIFFIGKSNYLLMSILFLLIHILWFLTFIILSIKRIRMSVIPFKYIFSSLISIVTILMVSQNGFREILPDAYNFVDIFEGKNIVTYSFHVPPVWKYVTVITLVTALLLPEISRGESELYSNGVIINGNEILRIWGTGGTRSENKVDTSLLERDIEFSDSFKRVFFTHVLDFEGRTTRREMASLSVGLYIVGFILNIYVHFTTPEVFKTIVYTTIILSFIPWLSMAVRRLHDGGNSGLWILFLWVPIINVYVLMMLFFQNSWVYNPNTQKIEYVDL
ncbi:DUF805 domain-containing protein [Veillonella caviae]|uniref:DUF805 domain-containing protein n=1 Tax=Veillonella caviae TaxID=248316 RepID=UPI0013E09F6D|nr:DUF805 domain-containing protein [Veillonella caviae]